MKLIIPIVWLTFAGAAFAQDLPEKSTDSLWRNDILFKALTSVKPHTLTDLKTRPDAYRGLPVEMEIQFHETRKGGNPFFTRFTDDNFLCFAAWGGEQALWDKEEYQKDFSFLFVDRNSLVFRQVLEAKVYNRLKVTAVTRDVFRGIPYVEVIKAELLSDSMSEAQIIHGAKAKKMAREGDTAGALAEFERAMRGGLPTQSKALMHIDLAQVYLQREDRDSAIAQLENAKKLQPNDLTLAKTIDKIKSTPLNLLKIDGLKEVPAELRDPKNANATSRPAAAAKDAASNVKKESAPESAAADKKETAGSNK